MATVLGGTALALSLTSAPVAEDLEARSVASLQTAHVNWASVRIDGRDAILSGTATTQAMIDDAVTTLASVRGIRAVKPEIVLAEFVSPFPFSAALADGTITLSGGYPSEAAHAAVVAGAGNIVDRTRLLSGGPAPALYESAAKFALASLDQLDQGEVALADLSLSVTGRAKSLEAYGELQTLRTQAPAGVSVAALTIVPPLASPYVWTASFDGRSLALSGNIPDPTLETRFRALAPTGVAVSTSLALGSGEPAGFADKALTLLKTLLLLENGEAAITDGAITLSGAPATPAIADEVVATLADLGGTATLEPPRIADFSLTADKSAGALKLTGYIPDNATRERLAALPGADITGLQLGRGAPDRFASGLDFGLDLLGLFTEGRFELSGTKLALSGRTGSLTDYRTLLAKVAEGAPQGFTLSSAAIRPPLANPYAFKAVRDSEGVTALTGFIPDDAARAELVTHIAELGTDRTDPADGAPDNFVFLAGKGLDVLALLDTGTLAYDGKNWTIEGLVDTAQQGFAADAAFSAAGLRTLGFTYNVRQPTLPIISPYTWRAQKTGDGAVSIAGFSPNATFRAQLAQLAPAAMDSMAMGAGAPADFEPSALAGFEALLALDEGSLGLNGNLWTLAGEVADTATRERVQTALSAKVDTANWRIAIQARDSAPVITPYLWSATKAADGLVDLAGYAPSEPQKAAAAARAGRLGRDTTAIASGEPAGFADDVAAGLTALAQLTEGKAAFDGSRWVLTGTAASQAQGEAAIAALRKGSRDGAAWTSLINGYTPPAPSEPSSESSSVEPLSSEPPVSPVPSEEPISSEPISSAPEASSSTAPIELSSSEPPAAEPSSSEPPPAEPTEDRSLIVVDPLPARFLFEASKDSGQPIVLTGIVPREEIATELGLLAGDVATDRLVVRTDLPLDFGANAVSGLSALGKVNEGRLGFDGARWWLRGTVETTATRDAITSSIAALSNGKDWSVFVGVLTPLEICKERVAALERLNAITFESGSARLTESSLPVLDELAVDLNICADASVHVEGHTDSDGAEDLNLALSVSRAEAVVMALIERGVDVERLYAEGYGESQPIADNETREGKARNRRIAFSISKE